jgi:hypothetical protein
MKWTKISAWQWGSVYQLTVNDMTYPVEFTKLGTCMGSNYYLESSVGSFPCNSIAEGKKKIQDIVTNL